MVYTVAWTMGKQRRVVKELESQTTDLPPPGNYGVPPKQESQQPPQWSIGKEPKNKTYSDGQPGPLEYQIPSKVDEGPKFSMGSKTFYNRNPLLTDTGPGDYDPDGGFKKSSNVYKENLSATIAGRSKTPRDEGLPGPGQYDNENRRTFIPGAGLGKSPRRHKKTNTGVAPGPGSYTVEKFSDQNNGPRFGFGTDKKNKKFKARSPGPGQYGEKKVLSQGAPGYSIKGRRPD